MTQENYDILICGGGMIGLATALGLAKIGLKIAIIEARKPLPFSSEQDYDLRVSALSPKTIDTITELGAWEPVERMRLCHIQEMRVWENPTYGDVTFTALSVGRSDLGAIVENRVVQLALWEIATANENIEFFCPSECADFVLEPGQAIVHLNNGESLSGRLLIGTDGMQSAVRNAFPFGSSGGQYKQSCLVASAKILSPQGKVAWQRFTPQGPQAFLPLTDKQGSLIWYNSVEKIKALSKLSNDQLSEKLSEEFPLELGPIEIEGKASFPISKHHVRSYVHENVLLAGDAAHTINPLAGQGVNLGFQDVSVLMETFREETRRNRDWSTPKALKKYDFRRRTANSVMMGAIDAFYFGFSNDHVPLKILRNTALFCARLPLINKQIIRYGSGLT